MGINDISAHARLFRRHSTHVEASVEPHEDHAAQVRFSSADARMQTAVVDVSKGGVGLESGSYLPKNLRVTLRISCATPSDDDQVRDLTIRGIVRRSVMVDHKPTYHIGVEFADARGHDEQTLIKSATKFLPSAGQVVPIGGPGVS